MTREEIYKCFDEEDNDIKTARIYISMDIVRNMLKQEFTLDQIQKSLPWLSKPDIFGYSYIVENPVKATEEEREEIKWAFRVTGCPEILETVFNTKEEQEKRIFAVSACCPNCGYCFSQGTKLTINELQTMDQYYKEHPEVSELTLIIRNEAPVSKHITFTCPDCYTKFERNACVYKSSEVGYAEHEGKWLKYRIENKKENGYEENNEENYEEGKAEVLDEVKKAFKTVKENHFTTVNQVVEAGFDRNIAETVISNL